MSVDRPTFFVRLLIGVTFCCSAHSAHAQSTASSPESVAPLAPTPLPSATPTHTPTATSTPQPPPGSTPTPTPTPWQQNRICRDPNTEIDCGPTSVTKYQVFCTSQGEIFAEVRKIDANWEGYLRNIAGWVPWFDAGHELRMITNWQTAQSPLDWLYGNRQEFWTDINGTYDSATGNLISSGWNVDPKKTAHCIKESTLNTENPLVCGCGRQDATGCFPPGVKIRLFDGTDKNVEDLIAGDALLNPILGEPVYIQRIVEGPEKAALIEFGYDSVRARVSEKHPVLIRGTGAESPLSPVSFQGRVNSKGSWRVVKAEDLRIGDTVQDQDGAEHAITSVERLPIEEGQIVINFVLDTPSKRFNDRMVLSDGVVTGDLVVQQMIAKSTRDAR